MNQGWTILPPLPLWNLSWPWTRHLLVSWSAWTVKSALPLIRIVTHNRGAAAMSLSMEILDWEYRPETSTLRIDWAILQSKSSTVKWENSDIFKQNFTSTVEFVLDYWLRFLYLKNKNNIPNYLLQYQPVRPRQPLTFNENINASYTLHFVFVIQFC